MCITCMRMLIYCDVILGAERARICAKEMSGVRQKGPERPTTQSTATVSNASEQQSIPAPIYKQPVLEGKWPVSRRGFTDETLHSSLVGARVSYRISVQPLQC